MSFFMRVVILAFLAMPFAHAGTFVDDVEAATFKTKLPMRLATVTSLANSGPGSLRDVIARYGGATNAMTRVVFAVSGTIDITQRLDIMKGNLIIDGLIAPEPGITIRGGGFRIAASNVALRNLRIHVGDRLYTPQQDPFNSLRGDDRDAIQIVGTGPTDTKRVENILIEKNSMYWSVDEMLSTYYNVKNVVIRHNILAEPLNRSLHTKQDHAMNLLIGPGAENVLIFQNLMAHGMFRNPAIAPGTKQIYVVNNVVYDSGYQAWHFYNNHNKLPTVAVVHSNAILSGPTTNVKFATAKAKGGALLGDTANMLPKAGHEVNPGSKLVVGYNFRDGVALPHPAADKTVLARLGFNPFVNALPEQKAIFDGLKIYNPQNAKNMTFLFGARPLSKNDQRLLFEMVKATGSSVDKPVPGMF